MGVLNRLRVLFNPHFGEIIVEGLDVNGQALVTSKPIQADALDIPVEWQISMRASWVPSMATPGAEDRIPPIEKLRIRLKNARLFAVWCK